MSRRPAHAVGVVTSEQGRAAFLVQVPVGLTRTVCPNKRFRRSDNRGLVHARTTPPSPSTHHCWQRRLLLVPHASGITKLMSISGMTLPLQLLLLLLLLTSELLLRRLASTHALLLLPATPYCRCCCLVLFYAAAAAASPCAYTLLLRLHRSGLQLVTLAATPALLSLSLNSIHPLGVVLLLDAFVVPRSCVDWCPKFPYH